jgi:mono/diheme cytochrome c family protein
LERLIKPSTAMALILLGALLAGGGYWLLRGGAAGSGLLRSDDAAVVARGRVVYTQHCARCHGADLAGQPNWRERGPDGLLPAPPHDRSGHTWHHPGQVLFNITKYGVQHYAGPQYRSAMPRYEGTLADEDIVAVLSYIQSTWPPDVRRLHDTLEAEQRKR